MFTPEELAAMRAADEEIERTFRLTAEDLEASRLADRDAKLERLDNKARKIAAAQREYRAANRDKIAAAQREYYAANRDKIAAAQREYRAANRDKIAAAQREYYAANRDKIAAAQREYRAANRKRTAFADLLAQKSLSQAAAAQKIGVSQMTISNWALGIYPPNVGRICAVWPEYGGET